MNLCISFSPPGKIGICSTVIYTLFVSVSAIFGAIAIGVSVKNNEDVYSVDLSAVFFEEQEKIKQEVMIISIRVYVFIKWLFYKLNKIVLDKTIMKSDKIYLYIGRSLNY